MHYRDLGNTGVKVSAVSFGAWAIGGTWGAVDDREAMAALHAALDNGVTMFDTADVYGDGRSERLLAQLRRERREPFFIATKAGRRLAPHVAGGYTKQNLDAFLDRSLRNLNVETIDLLQLHCPPTQVYYTPAVFDALEDFHRTGKIRFAGVSVEKVEEGLKAIEFPVVRSVQIIFNMFRQRPAELFFREAARRGVGIIVRLPLSSGMLTGKFSRSSTFARDDHRRFNRAGEAFDRGETFSGVPFEHGLDVVERLRGVVPDGGTLTRMALRWILMFPEVSCVIPGGKTPSQVEENTGAADLPPLAPDVMARIREIYDVDIRPHVHHLW